MKKLFYLLFGFGFLSSLNASNGLFGDKTIQTLTLAYPLATLLLRVIGQKFLLKYLKLILTTSNTKDVIILMGL
jgi:hypothetical protein